jgi:DNA-binding IclR family transcriptional regulator
MGPTQSAILDVLKAHPQGLVIAAVVAAVDLPERSARRAIHRLAAAGAVQIGPTAWSPRVSRADYSGLLVRLP